MLAQRCVVACNSGGPTESVLHGKTGYLCNHTPQDFAKCMEKIVNNPKSAINMGIEGRKHVMQTFGRDQLVSQLDTIVNKIRARYIKQQMQTKNKQSNLNI